MCVWGGGGGDTASTGYHVRDKPVNKHVCVLALTTTH